MIPRFLMPRPRSPVPARLTLGPANVRERGPRNIFSASIARNPLISLDSDERIQGNPNKSNPFNRWFRDEGATLQENPNGSTGLMSLAGAARSQIDSNRGAAPVLPPILNLGRQ